MGNAQGSSTRALRIREHMQLRNGQTVQERIALLEILFQLSPCSHHHVHADEGIGHHLLDHLYLMCEQSRVVTTVHQFQHGIRTALQGNMEMWHEGPALCAIGYQVIIDQIGLQTTDAVAFHTLHLVECLDEIDEPLTG